MSRTDTADTVSDIWRGGTPCQPFATRERVVSSNPPLWHAPRQAVAFWTGPTLHGRWWTLAFGVRRDLSDARKPTLCRLRIRLTYERARDVEGPALVKAQYGWREAGFRLMTRLPARWRLSVTSDFDQIERRIAARSIVDHMVARAVNRPQPWTAGDMRDAWLRQQRRAWRTDDGRQALQAMALSDAIRAVAWSKGLTFDDRSPIFTSSRGWL